MEFVVSFWEWKSKPALKTESAETVYTSSSGSVASGKLIVCPGELKASKIARALNIDL